MASTRDRVREHRQRLREQGLRPVQIRVPDTRSPEFAEEAHRQSVAVAASTETGVEQRSWIMVDKVTTLPRRNVHDRIGQLADPDLVRLNRALVVFLGVAR